MGRLVSSQWVLAFSEAMYGPANKLSYPSLIPQRSSPAFPSHLLALRAAPTSTHQLTAACSSCRTASPAPCLTAQQLSCRQRRLRAVARAWLLAIARVACLPSDFLCEKACHGRSARARAAILLLPVACCGARLRSQESISALRPRRAVVAIAYQFRRRAVVAIAYQFRWVQILSAQVTSPHK